jgi:hypothetical protein
MVQTIVFTSVRRRSNHHDYVPLPKHNLPAHARIPQTMFASLAAVNPPSADSVSTNGWDTVYGMTTESANNALSKSYAKKLGILTIAETGPYGTMNCNLAAWQLDSTGSEAFVNMLVPVTTGTAHIPFGTNDYSLNGVSFVTQVKFTFINSTTTSSTNSVSKVNLFFKILIF